MKRKIRSLIADDHGIARCGRRPLFESEPDWEIFGEA